MRSELLKPRLVTGNRDISPAAAGNGAPAVGGGIQALGFARYLFGYSLSANTFTFGSNGEVPANALVIDTIGIGFAGDTMTIPANWLWWLSLQSNAFFSGAPAGELFEVTSVDGQLQDLVTPEVTEQGYSGASPQVLTPVMTFQTLLGTSFSLMQIEIQVFGIQQSAALGTNQFVSPVF